jgi:small subunit ribosomal protein S17
MSDIQETAVTEAETPVEKAIPAKEDLLQTRRTQKVGTVVSDKMDKTVVVAVNYVRRHPLYHKRITRTSKFLAHDENNLAKPGDIVRIEETRPMSKRKRWIVREIVEKAVQI